VPMIPANAPRLGQVLLNLLVNAAHAVDSSKAAQNEIQIATGVDSASTWIEVRDNGSGIAPEIRERIFEPFFTTKAVGIGTGLGLSLCRTYVQAMGGTIEVESALGRGSVFRVRLPLGEVDGVPAGPQAVDGPSVIAARVLVVDDDPMVIAALRRTLRDHQVEGIHSARAALELMCAPEVRFDVVLCDLMMPEMSGMDFYRALSRSHPDRAHALVFISGGSSPKILEFLESVDNPRFDKPFDADRLRACVAALAAKARTLRRAA
jgi:CheY-like chemotaxis protein